MKTSEIYCIGTIPWPTRPDNEAFTLIRHSDSDLPYLVHNPDVLQILSRCVGIYLLSSDFKTAYLSDERDVAENLPKEVKLSDRQCANIKTAIRENCWLN